jgi:hypothetical protein
MKVAIVTVIKNEASDLTAWLAWYKMLGVDTIILYEDWSADDTFEIAQAAAGCQDIRLFRTDPGIHKYWDRQCVALRAALAEFGQAFDWIGFLDGDEYLYVPRDDGIKPFLDGYQHANAVGVSWCLYGSNGHILKPHIPPVDAFTRHSAMDPGYNVMKSFVRPGKVGPEWFDMHQMDVEPPYVDTNGHALNWIEHGHVSNPPDWSKAKIMHYMGRSMEHIVARVRRRADLRLVTDNYWDNLGRNEVEDREPLRFLPSLYRHLLRLDNEVIARFVDACRQTVTELTRVHQPASLYWLKTSSDTVLCASTITGEVGHINREIMTESHCHPVFALRPVPSSDVVFLVSSRPDIPLRMSQSDHEALRGDLLREHRISTILSYHLTSIEGGADEIFALRHPHTFRLLSARPAPMPGMVGEIYVNREEAKAWESFHVVTVEDNVIHQNAALGQGLHSDYDETLLTAQGLLAWLTQGAAPPPSLFIAFLTALTTSEQRAFLRLAARAPLPDWAVRG